MKEINIRQLKESSVALFDDSWALLTAGTVEDYNTMTVSWGALGELWNKDVCFAFVRPQRYTYEFMEREELFTLSFFSEDYKKALAFCGKYSGRDCNKAESTGLTPEAINGSVGFKQSRITLLCRKLYFQDIKPEGFLDKSIDGSCYSLKDYHRMYVGEILRVITE